MTPDRLVFTLPDPDRTLAGIKLYQEITRPRLGPEFRYDESAGEWTLSIPRPAASRVEYLLEVQHADGGTELIPDPANGYRVGGPFGEKSEIRLPGYETPVWLEQEAPTGQTTEIEVRCRPFRARLPVIVWSPPDTSPTEPLPLLFVHDGPEYAIHAGLVRFLEVMLELKLIAPLRAALVPPVERNDSYSASAAYARAFAHEIMPTILASAPTPHGRSMRAGMGASLGALAMLHIHRRAPATFGGLFLQSGSYFRQRFDPQEAEFPRFRRISRSIGEVLAAGSWSHPIDISMTCGSIEENLANNRALGAALRRQGYEVDFHVNPDGHNWTGWRDTLDPHLTRFLTRMWS